MSWGPRTKALTGEHPRVWPNSLEIGRVRPGVGRSRPQLTASMPELTEFASNWSMSCQNWQYSAKAAEVKPELDCRIRQRIGQHGPNQPSSGRSLAEAHKV